MMILGDEQNFKIGRMVVLLIVIFDNNDNDDGDDGSDGSA